MNNSAAATEVGTGAGVDKAIANFEIESALLYARKGVEGLRKAVRAAFEGGGDRVAILDEIEDVVMACSRSTSALCLMVKFS
jgi:hypothetical protein